MIYMTEIKINMEMVKIKYIITYNQNYQNLLYKFHKFYFLEII